jgi:hypothetical protein
MTMDNASGPDAKKPALSPSSSPFLERLKRWDTGFSVFKGLGLVTLAASLGGGYLQYLNTYEQKVSELAQADMAAAASAFVEVSNAYAEIQMLQQLIYFNYSAASSTTDVGNKAMTTKAAQDAYQSYVNTRNALRKNTNIYVRKAELYVDWPSNLARDAAGTTALDGDPLTETLLGEYNFDCDAKDNFAHYDDTGPDRSTQDFCSASNETQKQAAIGSKTVFCAVSDGGKIDHSRPSREINWHSAKHHLIVMHYCFELAHNQISTARIWASGNDVSDQSKSDFLKRQSIVEASLDEGVGRLDAFLSLVMSQIERIRVKYRPSGPLCHVPVVREIIGTFSSICTPVRTAAGRS